MSDRKMVTENVQYDLGEIAAIISSKSPDAVDIYEYLTGQDVVFSGQDILIKQNKIDFGKQTKEIKNQKELEGIKTISRGQVFTKDIKVNSKVLFNIQMKLRQKF